MENFAFFTMTSVIFFYRAYFLRYSYLSEVKKILQGTWSHSSPPHHRFNKGTQICPVKQKASWCTNMLSESKAESRENGQVQRFIVIQGSYAARTGTIVKSRVMVVFFALKHSKK